MRVDVDLARGALEAELDTLYQRLREGGEGFAPVVESLRQPGLVLRRREADGEAYVYVEDTRHGRLAGCTVFNRLVEVDRRTDRFVRSPHSRIGPAYQRRGLARHIYARELEAGWCLVSGARQSPAAHALWQALGTRYRLGYAGLRGATLVCLGPQVPPDVLDDLGTRMVLSRHGAPVPWADPAGRTVSTRPDRGPRSRPGRPALCKLLDFFITDAWFKAPGARPAAARRSSACWRA